MSKSDFFEQLTAAIAETGRSGRCMPDSPAWREFMQNAPVKEGNSPVSVSGSPPQKTEAVSSLPASVLSGDLGKLQQEALGCRRCPLCEKRSNVVFGEGDPQAELMFIGEGPGFDEDRLGRPFVGKAGQLLDKMITAMQFSREEVYICNIVKCRPPDNRVPMPDEAAACMSYLERQIELISPKVIVLLGATAAHYLMNVREGITRLRGKWLDYKGIAVMPTYHPAFLLRQESAKKDAWADLQQVMAKFNKYHKR